MISLEQMVEPESLVRIIDAFIDMLDLEQFGFSYFKLNKEGKVCSVILLQYLKTGN